MPSLDTLPEVTVDQLRDLFTGVPDEDGSWASTPCYAIELAYEIARRGKPITDDDLRALVYDTTPADDIPQAAIQAITLAWQRYRMWLSLQPKRGL